MRNALTVPYFQSTFPENGRADRSFTKKFMNEHELPPPITTSISENPTEPINMFDPMPLYTNMLTVSEEPDFRFSLTGLDAKGRIKKSSDYGRVWDHQPGTNFLWKYNNAEWYDRLVPLASLFTDLPFWNQNKRTLNTLDQFGRVICDARMTDIGPVTVRSFINLTKDKYNVFRLIIRLASLWITTVANEKLPNQVRYTHFVQPPRADFIPNAFKLAQYIRDANNGVNTIIVPDHDPAAFINVFVMATCRTSPVSNTYVSNAAHVWPEMSLTIVAHTHEVQPMIGAQYLNSYDIDQVAQEILKFVGETEWWLEALRFVAFWLRRPSGVGSFITDHVAIHLPHCRLQVLALFPARYPNFIERYTCRTTWIKPKFEDLIIDGCLRAMAILSSWHYLGPRLFGAATEKSNHDSHAKFKMYRLFEASYQNNIMMAHINHFLGLFGLNQCVGRLFGSLSPTGPSCTPLLLFGPGAHHITSDECIAHLPILPADSSIQHWMNPTINDGPQEDGKLNFQIKF